MVNVGFIMFLVGLGASAYFGYTGEKLISLGIPILLLAVGGLLMQTKDGKLFNLYYRESKGLENHLPGVLYIIKLLAYSLVFPGGVLCLVMFGLGRLFS